MSTANPLEIIHTAVNRASNGAEGADRRPFIGEQAMSLGDALRAHTAGVAYLNHDENRSGSVAVGKDGDVVILDRDVFEHPVGEIADASVTYTIMGGAVLYESADHRR